MLMNTVIITVTVIEHVRILLWPLQHVSAAAAAVEPLSCCQCCLPHSVGLGDMSSVMMSE